MNISENICPVCETKNEAEAAVCERCGTSLEHRFLEPGHKTKTTDMEAPTPEMIRDWLLKESKQTAVPDNGIAFYIEGRSIPAYIDAEEEFILGRKAGTTSELLLDLAPFGGYSLGISRRHALIRKSREGYMIMDLGSVNGTFLNEERLAPHRAYALPSRSHLRLGRMRLLVLYQLPG